LAEPITITWKTSTTMQIENDGMKSMDDGMMRRWDGL